MRKWYRMVVEYECPDDWSIGVVPGLDPGDMPGLREVAEVLRAVVRQLEMPGYPGEKAPGLVYESLATTGAEGGNDGEKK